MAGGALTLAYGVFITILGFPLATFIYLVAFMYLGGYRAHATVWLSSPVGIVLIANLFLNVVYVSLPRGDFAVRPRDGPHHQHVLIKMS